MCSNFNGMTDISPGINGCTAYDVRPDEANDVASDV